jgi:adenosylcobinamide-phosphate synthase
MHASLALIALAVDAACGYPQALFRALGHPVSWIGRLIAWCETVWNKPELSFARRRLNGALVLFVCLAAALAVSEALVLLSGRLAPFPFDVLIIALAASTLLAQRSLHEHVGAVARALEEGDVAQARRAVARIVGRDTAALPATGIARAAIESLAENFSDGVVAPVFWLIAAGLPGAALYKTVNTADSMVGHKSDRYRAFGWAAARLDDLLNLPASRLAALWLVAGAALCSDATARAAVTAIGRDARRHRSPNAGWPEAAVAGALGLRLGGPRLYGGVLVADSWMGNGRNEADAGDIGRALRLYRAACLVQAGAVALLALALNL